MTQFLITKRTTCEACKGEQPYVYHPATPNNKLPVDCPVCGLKGYTDEMVDADEWLLERVSGYVSGYATEQLQDRSCTEQTR